MMNATAMDAPQGLTPRDLFRLAGYGLRAAAMAKARAWGLRHDFGIRTVEGAWTTIGPLLVYAGARVEVTRWTVLGEVAFAETAEGVLLLPMAARLRCEP